MDELDDFTAQLNSGDGENAGAQQPPRGGPPPQRGGGPGGPPGRAPPQLTPQ